MLIITHILNAVAQ